MRVDRVQQEDLVTITFKIHRFTPQSQQNSPSLTAVSRRTEAFRASNSNSDNSISQTAEIIDETATSATDFSSARRTDRSRSVERGSSPFSGRSRSRRANPFASEKSGTRCSTGSPFGSQSSSRTRGKSWVQEYVLVVPRSTTILQCLLTIKQQIDPTLTFRYSCGHGMCGSDAANVNGTPTLLCTAQVGQWMTAPTRSSGFRKTGQSEQSQQKQDTSTIGTAITRAGTKTEQALPNEGSIELSALSGFSVVRDLIADIDPMLEQIRKLDPVLKPSGLRRTKEGKIDVFEYLQNPEELARYELLSNCIACGVCEGSCPVYAGGEAFIGPAALIAASRFINDSRDSATQERLEALTSADGVAACQSVRACSRQCPRGIDVGEEIWQLITKVQS